MLTYLYGPVPANGRAESVDAKRGSHIAVVLVVINEECLFGHIARLFEDGLEDCRIRLDKMHLVRGS